LFWRVSEEGDESGRESMSLGSIQGVYVIEEEEGGFESNEPSLSEF
jgi:hypothetical protein